MRYGGWVGGGGLCVCMWEGGGGGGGVIVDTVEFSKWRYFISINAVYVNARNMESCSQGAIWNILDTYREMEHLKLCPKHYNDFIMGVIASQITSLTIVYSIVYSCADQRKNKCFASLTFVRSPVISPHKGPVTRKMFPFYDVIISLNRRVCSILSRLFLFQSNAHELIKIFFIKIVNNCKWYYLKGIRLRITFFGDNKLGQVAFTM